MPAGRPRTFDVDAAVDAAMLLFWEQGYEGTSLADLRAAMRISSASFYAAFESKAALFERALKRYVSSWGAITDVVRDPGLSGRDAIARLLHGSIDMQTDPRHPAGCLVALSSGLTGEQTPTSVRDAVARRREEDRQGIEWCVIRAVDTGELRQDTDVIGLSGLLHGLLLGLSVQIRDGAEPKSLHSGADASLHVWDAFAASV
ncbi:MULTISPECIES: TetR/AcrR family transcriptional regulator [unclassified Saccharopolyspora]|uniref:TetR/AcrR family transcriptional regulator n=1 Tax=unclassified Saccharopolyspora TaxID=2646250 RepID=UPI001CD3FA66|nr:MULTISPECIES: TetR/AcrR family transcriptional regulator [unclassified Saccharopolyspora]MCA1186990.1 TetR/AcrR family transcriptional regulator [Saccharopolyspora sp. 6T]MCA1192631.1 TetR/AcrR family transcriptional regulator [Saccharopolyspora sp. 6V]MCA1229637.1 TetR/AcrR family transcriptional regulator [Saccharopolyspora sp. 6M]MCA1283461.1 TetR/AcrR family transcriptional regulator [Saccharopolyspora sp. 7B]